MPQLNTVLAALLLQSLLIAQATPGVDPFAFFRPTIAITDEDRARLDAGGSVARVVHADDPEVSVFAAVPVDVDGNRLVAWMRRIDALKKSDYVQAIGVFSTPPRIEDLTGLSLDEGDLAAIRSCRAGHCGMKLAGPEMQELQRAADGAGAEWRDVLQVAFRRLVLRRVQTYLARGLGAAPAYEDHSKPVLLQDAFASLLRATPFLAAGAPALADYLARRPAAPTPRVESILYWSKERLAGKPLISATEIAIVRGTDPHPDALVAGKQIFATHYLNGSLSVTAIVRGRPPASHYLLYVNRTSADVLNGWFSGIVRMILERRLRGEAPAILQGLRRRLESGLPPALTTSRAASNSARSPRASRTTRRASTSCARSASPARQPASGAL